MGEDTLQSEGTALSAEDPKEAGSGRGNGKGAEGITAPRVTDNEAGERQGETEEEEFSEWRVHPRLTPRRDMALQVGCAMRGVEWGYGWRSTLTMRNGKPRYRLRI